MKSFKSTDIDECIINRSKCDNNTTTCENNIGNYTCKCKEGFEEEANVLFKCHRMIFLNDL